MCQTNIYSYEMNYDSTIPIKKTYPCLYFPEYSLTSFQGDTPLANMMVRTISEDDKVITPFINQFFNSFFQINTLYEKKDLDAETFHLTVNSLIDTKYNSAMEALGKYALSKMVHELTEEEKRQKHEEEIRQRVIKELEKEEEQRKADEEKAKQEVETLITEIFQEE